MKKSQIILKLAALLLSVFMLAACFCTVAFADNADIDLTKVDFTPHVNLGDYKDLNVFVDFKTTDEELYDAAVINDVYTVVTTRATKAGDIVNVSYVGKIAVSSGKMIPVRGGKGTATITLEDASGKEIADLIRGDDKLIGVEPGKSVDVTVKMPDNYSESAMAGRTVVFTVSVQSIIQYGYTDEYVAKKYADYGCKTVEDLRLHITKEKLLQYDTIISQEVYYSLLAKSDVTIPTSVYDYYYGLAYDKLKTIYESDSASVETYGSFEEFLDKQGTIVLAQLKEMSKNQAEQATICAAIYNAGLISKIDDGEYSKRLSELASAESMTVDELQTLHTGDNYISNMIIVGYVYDNLSKIVNLTSNYGEYAYLIENETDSDVTTEQTGAGEQGGFKLGTDVIIMIVIIAVGFVGCIVLLILQRKLSKGEKKKRNEDEDDEDDEEYDDDEDEDYDEEDEDYDEEDEDDEEDEEDEE